MWPTYVTLTGLVVDIIGAFVLAVEVIGVDRVRAWGRQMRVGVGHPRSHFKIGGYVFLGYLCLFVPIFVFSPMPHPMSLLQRAAILGVSVVMSAAAYAGLMLILANVGRLFTVVQRRARRGPVGLLGFALLAAGFALQFAGTLWSALAR